jgi:hypothetical protein
MYSLPSLKKNRVWGHSSVAEYILNMYKALDLILSIKKEEKQIQGTLKWYFGDIKLKTIF